MGRHSAREIWDESKHRRGSRGRFVIIDHFDGPPVKTLAATRAWLKAGRPKTRDVYRVRAASARAAWEHQFGSPLPESKFKTRSARSAMPKR